MRVSLVRPRHEYGLIPFVLLHLNAQRMLVPSTRPRNETVHTGYSLFETQSLAQLLHFPKISLVE
jgi:hypothetical protein